MTTFFFILALILALVGAVGAVLPALPGPPISWVGLLLAYFAADGEITMTTLLVMLTLTVVVTVLDYFAPGIVTKIGGGSKSATRGANIGMVVGLFMGPLGLLLGPLVGAFIGEYIAQGPQPVNAPVGTRVGNSLRIALLSFVGFLLTTGLKLILCLWMAWQIIKPIIALIFS